MSVCEDEGTSGKCFIVNGRQSGRFPFVRYQRYHSATFSNQAAIADMVADVVAVAVAVAPATPRSESRLFAPTSIFLCLPI